MILHFVNSFVGRAGNIGARTTHLLNALAARGDSVTCVCRGAEDTPGSVEVKAMGWLGHVPRALNGLRIYLAPQFNHRFADIRLFEWFAARALSSESRLERACIAHVWDNCPRLLRWLKAKGIPTVLDVPIAPMTYARDVVKRAGREIVMYDPRFAQLELETYTLADVLLAPSEFVAEELRRAGVPDSKISVVQFGVDPPITQQSARERSRSGLDFCFVGNVNERKGARELLEAWTHPMFAEDRLHLCGRVFPEMKATLGKLSVSNVVLPGFVRPFEYLPDCDVFVFPTWMEGSSKAVFEAMACGLPAIVTRSAGSIVRDGCEGFVLQPGNTGALRARMKWFKDHPEQVRTMGEAARARAREFSWQRYAANVLNIYSQVS